MCHNNFEADILSKIVNDVEAEPELQPVRVETIDGLSGNASRFGIRARDVWKAGQSVFFFGYCGNKYSISFTDLSHNKNFSKGA